jgi:hypothetical protein
MRRRSPASWAATGVIAVVTRSRRSPSLRPSGATSAMKSTVAVTRRAARRAGCRARSAPVRRRSTGPACPGGPRCRAMSSTSSSPVTGSKSAHLTTAPTRSAAAAHGRTSAPWSRVVKTTSSPGPQPRARVRARSKVSWVMLRPNTTPRGWAPSRSATAIRAPTTIASDARSPAVTVRRLARPAVRAPATAPATDAGVCDPPGPSKKAVPVARAANRLRRASTSYGTSGAIMASACPMRPMGSAAALPGPGLGKVRAW